MTKYDICHLTDDQLNEVVHEHTQVEEILDDSNGYQLFFDTVLVSIDAGQRGVWVKKLCELLGYCTEGDVLTLSEVRKLFECSLCDFIRAYVWVVHVKKTFRVPLELDEEYVNVEAWNKEDAIDEAQIMIDNGDIEINIEEDDIEEI